ncbi:TRAP transporter small permease [Youngiibacter fragilis]|uniref:Tripartite ATP-independent periplasmic transporters DctQ component domain-containing protein n=1 Tax=Youngiibacter fragilis 232.1 TaxID=994573 RepID=V7I6H8_9CLOT|nr:TRAP transporter small permease [Youngiibacter fragilis]ETA80901.1 hypothetical protein T472_0210040 [Youngiibacter fragilis 232.1]
MIKKILDYVAAIIKAFLGLLLGIMLIVALTEVFRRYFIGKSFPWSEESIRYLIIWISLLGGAVSYKEHGLVYFDMIVDLVKGKKKGLLMIFSNTVTLAFIGYIFMNSIGSITSRSIMNQKSIGLQISMVIPYMAIPIGMGLMFIFGLYHYKEIYDKYFGGATK